MIDKVYNLYFIFALNLKSRGVKRRTSNRGKVNYRSRLNNIDISKNDLEPITVRP